VARKTDITNLASLFRRHHGFVRPAGSEVTVGNFEPDVFMKLDQIYHIHLEAPQRSLSVVNAACFFPLLALLMSYDWWSTDKVPHVTIWASSFLVAMQQLRHPLSHTAVWQAFATWAQSHAISFH
jgi:hypothetical protein